MNLQSFDKISGILWWESGIQGCNAMSVEVIHYKNNLLSRRILFCQQPIYLLCPILSSPSFLGVGISPTSQRLCKKENTCCAVADILVILILNAILFGAESFAEVGKKPDRLFIHANNGIVFVIWATVYFKHVFHRSHKSGTVFRRNAPAFLQVRLKFVFLRMFETVTCDIDSIYPSSTVLSARSRSVHLEYPSGGCPHASAMMCASTSPVTFAGIGGVSRFFLVIVASRPFLQ